MMTRKLLRTAWLYKSQFISMIIMIALGIGIFLGFNIEWQSIEVNTSEFFSETNYADFRLYADSGFSKEDIAAIKEIDGVDEATRYLSVNVDIKDTKKSVTLNVSEDYNVSTMYITEGAKYDETSDGIWLSDRFAEENDIAVGDTLTFTYQNTEVSGEVTGLVKSGENMICVADENQIMPDYKTHGFAYITPQKLENSLGTAFYPQINLISDMQKAELDKDVRDAVGKTVLITEKDLHTAYAGAKSESEEGKTMGLVLPVLFLAIAILTMVTTMHRIAANEKTQIGTLKALGFRDRRILRHYTSYGFVIGIIGVLIGTGLGYAVAAVIMSPKGMMSTYFDMPKWQLVMPGFCIAVIVLTVMLLTLISYLSTRKMLNGTAADALRPYTPKAMRKTAVEKMALWNRLSFSVKWNVRDILRHKARSAMTLLGVFGCMLLIVGGLGMKDTMQGFLKMLDDSSNYNTKVNITETAANEDVLDLAEKLDGDWVASSGISYDGDTVTLEIYDNDNGKVRFLSEDKGFKEPGDDGVYLCLRLKDTADIGDTIEISPYGSEKIYEVKVAGYFRSVVSESIIMTDTYAESIGIDYHISSIYTDVDSDDVGNSPVIAGKQSKNTVMDSYDTFLDIMNMMVVILVIAAIILGIVVLYNLGIMSYVERRRELATLKVLGFRDKAVGRLLISQNIWLTVVGVIVGLPGGAGVLYVLLKALASEYELKLTLGALTYFVSVILTFGVSLLVGLMVARKNKAIDMVEALKTEE